MSFSLKKIPAIFLLLCFLTLVLFGFAMMAHGEDSWMTADCPLATLGGTSLCSQDKLAIVLHHVSAYNTFLNIPIPAGVSALLVALLVLTYLVFSFYIFPRIFARLSPRQACITSSFVSPLGRKIVRWLSLLEHSPSAT